MKRYIFAALTIGSILLAGSDVIGQSGPGKYKVKGVPRETTKVETPDEGGEADRIATIKALEQKLAQTQGTFNWGIHNELRHHYGAVDMRKSFYHSDQILRHSRMDSYIMNILSGWELDKDAGKAVANLSDSADRYPEFRFVAAACWVKMAELVENDDARTLLTKVKVMPGSDMATYRALAEEALRRLDPSAEPEQAGAYSKKQFKIKKK